MSTKVSTHLILARIQRSIDKLIGSLLFTPKAQHNAKLQGIAELVAVMNWLKEIKEDN